MLPNALVHIAKMSALNILIQTKEESLSRCESESSGSRRVLDVGHLESAGATFERVFEGSLSVGNTKDTQEHINDRALQCL